MEETDCHGLRLDLEDFPGHGLCLILPEGLPGFAACPQPLRSLEGHVPKHEGFRPLKKNIVRFRSVSSPYPVNILCAPGGDKGGLSAFPFDHGIDCHCGAVDEIAAFLHIKPAFLETIKDADGKILWRGGTLCLL